MRKKRKSALKRRDVLYRAIDVWRRLNPATAVRYRCFEILQTHRFVVQSSDFYRHPPSKKKDLNFEEQFVELFVEDPPETRDKTFATIEEAIAAHDKNFAWARKLLPKAYH